MLAGSGIWDTICKYQNRAAEVARNAVTKGRSGTQYAAMETELLRACCVAQ